MSKYLTRSGQFSISLLFLGRNQFIGNFRPLILSSHPTKLLCYLHFPSPIFFQSGIRFILTAFPVCFFNVFDPSIHFWNMERSETLIQSSFFRYSTSDLLPLNTMKNISFGDVKKPLIKILIAVVNFVFISLRFFGMTKSSDLDSSFYHKV